MKKMAIRELQPGLTVARDVRGSGGGMILSKGSVLSAAIIGRLSRLGITEVAIEGQEGDATGDRAQRLAELEHRFAGHDGNPFMQELKRVIRVRLEGAGPQG